MNLISLRGVILNIFNGLALVALLQKMGRQLDANIPEKET